MVKTMADQQRFNRFSYNSLDSADSDDLSIQTDSQGYHEIKVYNEVRDRMWQLLSDIVASDNINGVVTFASHLQIMLIKGDSIWRSIQESAQIKAKSLTLDGTKGFKYNNELETISEKVKRYIDFYNAPELFQDKYGRLDKEYEEFMQNLTEIKKLEFVKKKMAQSVADADKVWGTLAAKIGLGLPLKIAEERELFFRGR